MDDGVRVKVFDDGYCCKLLLIFVLVIACVVVVLDAIPRFVIVLWIAICIEEKEWW